ncbi:MAG: NADH-quinone oxidoreductase subunit N [Bacteroidia bacterium]|nr:NADH-quinone oxidoreductase subunit N [Bacteroidia bacterium]
MIALFTIAGLGILALLAEIFKFRKLLSFAVPMGVLAAYCLNFYEWNHPIRIEQFANMLQFGKLELAFSGVLLATAFFWFIFANDYFENESSSADHFALVCFALTGAIMLVSYTNMTMLFLGVEILSIPLYVMAASRKSDISSNEAGFKYFLMGAFASGFLLFGIALVYGATGSFDLATIADSVRIMYAANAVPGFLYVGVLMMLIAMCFKVAAAPFHFWSPDVYQGSPTVVTAFMSTIVKTAGFVAFMRLFNGCFFSVSDKWTLILAVISAASLVISNITAASQSNVKRMLAYSSISHAGFMLMAIIANSQTSTPAILYYSLAYSISSIGGFTILYNLTKGKEGQETFDLFNGLGKRNPMIAACMVVILLSLAGIPVTSGFFAKYYVLAGLMGKGFGWLIVLAIVMSAVGVYYYFKIIIAMYFKKPDIETPVAFESSHAALIGITTAFTILLGFVPQYIIGMLS